MTDANSDRPGQGSSEEAAAENRGANDTSSSRSNSDRDGNANSNNGGRSRRGPRTKADWLNDIRRVADELEADDASVGDLKILSRALRELRQSFRMFSGYRHCRKVSVFGSARTPPSEPTYQAALDFGRLMANQNWMVLTGAGSGIMEAAHVGAGRAMSMGVNIILPFEQEANPVIADDEKLVNLRYFFTRKLLFVKEVHAIVLFPGGFGTQDECFETLTLVQTGKRDLMPVVCVDVPGGTYWKSWADFIRRELHDAELISPADLSLFHVTESIEDAAQHVLQFYRVYHSMRYVRNRLYLRIQARPSGDFLDRLNADFADLLSGGSIEVCDAHPYEADETHIAHLPRLRLQFNRRDFGRLRQMLDVLNREVTPDPNLVAETERRTAAQAASVFEFDPD